MRVGRSWQELTGVSRSWQELAGVGWSWLDLAGGSVLDLVMLIGTSWQEIPRIGRRWQELAGADRSLQESVELVGGGWNWLEAPSIIFGQVSW